MSHPCPAQVTATVDAFAADKLVALLRPDLPVSVRQLLFEVIHNKDAVKPRPREPSFEATNGPSSPDDVAAAFEPPRPSADHRESLVSTNSNPETLRASELATTKPRPTNHAGGLPLAGFMELCELALLVDVCMNPLHGSAKYREQCLSPRRAKLSFAQAVRRNWGGPSFRLPAALSTRTLTPRPLDDSARLPLRLPWRRGARRAPASSVLLRMQPLGRAPCLRVRRA